MRHVSQVIYTRYMQNNNNNNGDNNYNNFLVVTVVLCREPLKKTTGAILRGFTMTDTRTDKKRRSGLEY